MNVFQTCPFGGEIRICASPWAVFPGGVTELPFDPGTDGCNFIGFTCAYWLRVGLKHTGLYLSRRVEKDG